jgi:hypothetical protein
LPSPPCLLMFPSLLSLLLVWWLLWASVGDQTLKRHSLGLGYTLPFL